MESVFAQFPYNAVLGHTTGCIDGACLSPKLIPWKKKYLNNSYKILQAIAEAQRRSPE